jgi:transcriptional regulator with XRE-family HTH domain
MSAVKKPARIQPKHKPRNAAEYISSQIDLCGKSQLQISEESGFTKPNMITMIKQGKTKLPLSKIASMAKALEVDPTFLFRLVMEEYLPEAWDVIQEILSQPAITQNEFDIIALMRKANPSNPKISTQDEQREFAKFVSSLKSDND